MASSPSRKLTKTTRRSKNSSNKRTRKAKKKKTKGYAVLGFAVYKVMENGKLSIVKKFRSHDKAVEYAMGLARRMKLPVAILTKESQTGSSNEVIDVRYKALPPGKRISRSGKVYYEYRRNRSDDPGGLL